MQVEAGLRPSGLDCEPWNLDEFFVEGAQEGPMACWQILSVGKALR